MTRSWRHASNQRQPRTQPVGRGEQPLYKTVPLLAHLRHAMTRPCRRLPRQVQQVLLPQRRHLQLVHHACGSAQCQRLAAAAAPRVVLLRLLLRQAGKHGAGQPECVWAGCA